jgi:predicted metal-binding protein
MKAKRGRPVDKFGKYVKKALESEFDDAIIIRTSDVYTAPWVRLKCRFGCPWYGKGLTCPPHTPTPGEMRLILDSYTTAILLHRNWGSGRRNVSEFHEALLDLELVLFFDGHYKAWGMGTGPCRRCEKCNVSGGCVHAETARPSMEACGIDVFGTARYHGISLRVLRGWEDERHSCGLLLIE